MTTTRGVVVCPTYQIEGNNFSLNADVSAQELRRYLLYWDRIAYAFPNGFGAPNLDALHDLRFLNQEGLLSLHDTRVTAEDIGYSGVRTPPHISAASGALFSNEEPNTSNPTGLMILGAPASLWRELNYFAPELAAVHLGRVDGSAGTSRRPARLAGTAPARSCRCRGQVVAECLGDPDARHIQKGNPTRLQNGLSE